MAMRAKVPISDRGPWKLFHSAPPEGRLVGVISEDFENDVTLRVDGDFYDEEQKLAYCEWLLNVLNTRRPVRVDEMDRLSKALLCRHDDSSFCTDECRAKALALRIIRFGKWPSEPPHCPSCDCSVGP